MELRLTQDDILELIQGRLKFTGDEPPVFIDCITTMKAWQVYRHVSKLPPVLHLRFLELMSGVLPQQVTHLDTYEKYLTYFSDMALTLDQTDRRFKRKRKSTNRRKYKPKIYDNERLLDKLLLGELMNGESFSESDEDDECKCLKCKQKV